MYFEDGSRELIMCLFSPLQQTLRKLLPKREECFIALCVDLNIWSASMCAHTSMSSLQINV